MVEALVVFLEGAGVVVVTAAAALEAAQVVRVEVLEAA